MPTPVLRLVQGIGISASVMLAEGWARTGYVSSEKELGPENLESMQFRLDREERARGNAEENGP